MAGGVGNKKRYQYCIDSSGAILNFRALQSHTGSSFIHPTLQDNVFLSGFFQHICNVGCAINLHSIISSGLILGGQNFSNRQTVFFLPVDPRDKSHKDPDVIDLIAPRHAQYLRKALKKPQDAVYWVDINLFLENGLKFCQTRSNAIILPETLPAYCFPKVVRMETKSYTKKYTCHFELHQRSFLNTNGIQIWFQNTLSDQKLSSFLEVSNGTNQF